MARPRRPFGGVEHITESGDDWLASQVPGRLGARQRIRWDSSTHWAYRTRNSALDPLTHLHVLDAVANIDPDIELRAVNLTEYLNRERDQLLWDAVTVGKVLNDLNEAFEGILGAKMGILERGKDYRGYFYLIHHNPATADLYYRLREELMEQVAIEKARQATRDKSMRLGSPLLECASVRGEWVDNE